MAAPRQARRLQLQQDPSFHRRVLAIQRAGWAVMVVLIAATLLGVFGSGPLSRTTTDAPDGSLSLEHERFGRLGTQAILRARIRTEPVADGSVRLWVGREFLDRARIDVITPEPNHAAIGPEGVAYTFSAPEAVGTATVTIAYTPRRPGTTPGRVALEDRPPLRFDQFVYP